MPATKKILVIDDDEGARLLIADILRAQGDYTITTAQNSADGIEKAAREQPDMILLDLTMPQIDGYQACHILRTKMATHNMLIVMLAATDGVASQAHGLEAGADGVIAKPIDYRVFVASIDALLCRHEARLDANPLTRLPGNARITRELERCLQACRPFAVAYADIDNFKALNDHYGFVIGDQVLSATGRIIGQAVTPPDFVGHIGGDDFIVISVPERVEEICRDIITRFDQAIPQYYDPASREQGFIESETRQGLVQRVPLMTISIAVVTNRARPFRHVAEIGALAAELKRYLKTLPGSHYLVDRRQADSQPMRAEA